MSDTNTNESHRIVSKKKIMCTSKKQINDLLDHMCCEYGLSYEDSKFTLIEVLKDIECT